MPDQRVRVALLFTTPDEIRSPVATDDPVAMKQGCDGRGYVLHQGEVFGSDEAVLQPACLTMRVVTASAPLEPGPPPCPAGLWWWP